ncbi:MAG: flagellar basal body P-ring formation chaperone FlgA [Bryobacteraceae bacterium]|jgi:flagella basal body P-ring formation protein FlgA
MTLWIIWLAAGMAPGTSCVALADRWILAGDMAHALPAFAALPAETVLGEAPAAGSRRNYSSAELARLARRFGLTPEPGAEACFTRPLETLTRARVAAALRAAMPDAHVDLLDFSRQPVPPGELRFAPSADGRSQQVWRGTVSRPGQEDFPVWATVRVQASGMRVVAAESLPPGQIITGGQLRLVSGQAPTGTPDVSGIVGRTPRRTIAAGTPIEARWLEDPAEISTGELVQVEVRSGLARIRLTGRAQASGKRGQVIPVRNPANGKVFRAIVREHGQAWLPAGAADLAAGGEIP